MGPQKNVINWIFYIILSKVFFFFLFEGGCKGLLAYGQKNVCDWSEKLHNFFKIFNNLKKRSAQNLLMGPSIKSTFILHYT